MQTPKLEIRPYINLGLRRKWWIIIPFCLMLLGGGVFLAVCPKTYKATTLILLEPQSIPDSFVRSTVTETMEGRLRTITQQIHSRTYLERIIADLHLVWSEEGTTWEGWLRKASFGLSALTQKDSATGSGGNEQVGKLKLIDELRRNLSVTMRAGGGSGGREQAVVFEISFEWYDPEVIASVTNAIANRFIEENLNAREEQAVSTTDFFDKETAVIRQELEVREKELESFRKENMGMLPDQLESNNNILNQLRDQLANLERHLDQENQQAMMVKSQGHMARLEREALASAIRQDPARSGLGGRREPQLSSEQLTSGSLEDLETELRRLSSLYTDKHPDIVALKRRVETLRKEGEREGAHGSGSSGVDLSQSRINLQLAPINANIAAYKKQIADVEKQMQVYKDRVEKTPRVEVELNKILRDYQTVRQRYDNLLTRKLDAKLAEQMERRKKGEQFRVLDPAVKPPKPFRPDALKIWLVTVVAGLGLGCGLAFLREALDARFYSPEDVESVMNVEVVVSLPLLDAESVKQAV